MALKEVRTVMVIDASEGAFSAGDVVSDEDCTTGTANYWTFAAVVDLYGGCGYIVKATLVSETENQAVQYDLLLFNAAPTGQLQGGLANTNPLKGDRSSYLGTISFPQSTARGSTVATYTEASPSTVGNLPMAFRCGSTTTDIYGVLVTRTGYTHTNTDDIEIALFIEQ